MDECPNLDEGTIYEGKDHLEIDPDKCMECGSCAEACPIEAIDLC
jgi:NAD-dependent dihydropyrimidine dehydrogenase PreA subunit